MNMYFQIQKLILMYMRTGTIRSAVQQINTVFGRAERV